MKTYIGIDIGEKGAIAVMQDGQIMDVYKMPWSILSKRKAIDLDGITDLFDRFVNELDVASIMIERASMHLQSQKSASSMWFSYGLLLSVIKRTGIRYVELNSKEWQKEYGIKGDTKKQSISTCEALFPTLDIKFDGQRKNTKNDNIADAVLLAEYGKRKGY